MPAPNPVQRRASRAASDDLIAPCADEGGTFRDPVTSAPRPAPLLFTFGDVMSLVGAGLVIGSTLYAVFGSLP